MDALPMTELSQDLPYVSKNVGSAHMCGHDGHMTCLAGFVPLFLKEISSIPSNKKSQIALPAGLGDLKWCKIHGGKGVS